MPALIPASGLQQDVAVLRSALEKLHPGLLRYQTQEQSAESFARLAQELSRDLSEREVYLRLSTFTATLRCGHTYPNFFNQSVAVKHDLFDTSDRLPFFFRWIDGKMIVVQDFTPHHSLPPGTKIFSINGITSDTLLSTLMPYARSDGDNNAKRIDDLQVLGADTYEATDLLAPMIFQKWHGPYHLAVETLHAQKRKILVAAVSAEERNREALQAHPDPSAGGPLFTLRFLHNGTAVLSMPTWEVYNTKWDWSAWLNDALDQIVDRHAPSLIVDLRGNEGGNDVGDLILARLRDVSAASPSGYTPLIRYRKVPDEFRPYLRTYDKRARDWGASAIELAKPWPTAPPVHYFQLQEEPDPPSRGSSLVSKPYKGRVLVLVDASISSATFNFSRTIQQEHLGTLIGEPTGGNRRGINGGSFFFLRLPNSGLEIDIPLIGTFPTKYQPDEGLIPDVLVRVSREDIAASVDRAFNRAVLISDQARSVGDKIR
ncbi:MAG: S41 family peptidase [Acidobacteriaceae bacterium]